MAKDPSIYINHIKASIEKILSYTKNIDEDSFNDNPLIQDAVIRQFEIIGEATKRVDKNYREKYPKIPEFEAIFYLLFWPRWHMMRFGDSSVMIKQEVGQVRSPTEGCYKLHGVNFSPYIDSDEDPNKGGVQITDEELRERMETIAPYTEWIRTFGCNDDLKEAGINGVYVMGNIGEPVCQIAVGMNRVGMVLLGGLNPVAAAVEKGIKVENVAESGMIDFGQLQSFWQL